MSFLFISLYFITVYFVLEIAVVLLVTTGLDEEVTRFPVVSILTATGFTTEESELIARHPIRRKISIFLILFGVFSLAVIISFISSILVKDFRLQELFALTALFAAIHIFVKKESIHVKLTRRFKKHLKKKYELHEMPIQEILYIDDQDWFDKIEICKDSIFIHKKIDEVTAQEEDIQLLFVKRGKEKIRSELHTITFQEGDIFFLYGNNATIEKKFHQEIALQAASLDKSEV